MVKRILAHTGWRERLLWAATAASWGAVAAALAGRATTREFTVAIVAAFAVTVVTLQTRNIMRRMDRLTKAALEMAAAAAAEAAVEAVMTRQQAGPDTAVPCHLRAVTGPQAALQPPWPPAPSGSS